MLGKRLFGIIGKNIGHSFSPVYFNNKFLLEGVDAEYLLFDIQSVDELPALINKYPNLAGLSVTIPYKQQVFKYLKEVSDEAGTIGAVNCIKITETGLSGYNTDAVGFKKSLLPLVENKPDLCAMVLGTGGASKAVQYVLSQLNIPYTLVSRSGGGNKLSYKDVDSRIMEEHLLIINTTPLGMHPDTESFPDIPYDYITKNHILYDLIYNPEETTFLQKGKQQGAVIKNGLEMLHLQAEAAWSIWNK